MVTQHGPFDVLVAGSSLMSRAGLARIAAIHDTDPAMSVVLVGAGPADVHIADIVRTGAIDLLTSPVRPATLADALHRAIERRKLLYPSSPTTAMPMIDGATFTVSSATGGCGKTFYATNLAYFLAHHTRRRVLHRRLRPAVRRGQHRAAAPAEVHDLRSASSALDDPNLDDHIEEYLVPHETGISVLAAPKDPTEADRFSPPTSRGSSRRSGAGSTTSSSTRRRSSARSCSPRSTAPTCCSRWRRSICRASGTWVCSSRRCSGSRSRPRTSG